MRKNIMPELTQYIFFSLIIFFIHAKLIILYKNNSHMIFFAKTTSKLLKGVILYKPRIARIEVKALQKTIFSP